MMRRFQTLLATLALSCIASTAFAGIPMTEEEMIENATLIVRGAITNMACNGESTHNGYATLTPYVATLTITATEKGDDAIDEVTLPFAHTVMDNPDDFLSCGWLPQYREGHSGLFYLVTGFETEHYTLVDSGGFQPDDASNAEELPSCEEPEEEVLTCEDVTCGPCEACDGGECQPAEGHARACDAHADCEGGATCVSSADGCESFCSMEDTEEIAICEGSGGAWTECLLGIATTCENRDSGLDGASVCREGCLCPEDAPILTDEGCVAESACEAIASTSQALCEESDGTWDECAASSCDSCDDCIPGCLCEIGEFDPSLGCVALMMDPMPEAGQADGGCSGGGSGSTGFALLLALTLLGLGRLRRSTVTASLRG